MKKQFLLTLLLVLSALTLCSPQTHAQAPTCAGIRTLADCPDTGCGGPGADPLLNQMKNRTRDAASPETLTLGDIRQLRQPRRWPVGQERSSLARNEDRSVMVTGFLVRASASGQESTNCGLRGAANNDNHLDLLSTANAPRATAVTAEITPRVRSQRQGWDLRKLQFLAGQKMFVRVTGWLTLDTQHIESPLVRSTNWEVHPVTAFDVCTGRVNDCRRGDGWVSLEDWEIPRRRRR
jgi:hypothetical protein